MSRGRVPDTLRTEIAIVGAGISGMLTAYRAAREGRKVVVIDQGGLGSGDTGRTTAHVTSSLDRRWFELERLHGRAKARKVAESHATAIEEFQRLVRRERIACAFERVSGYLYASPKSEVGELEREFAAAKRLGIGVRWARRAPISAYDTGLCLEFPRQAQFHPLRFLLAVAEAFRALGGVVLLRTRAIAIEPGRPARIRLEGGGTIECDELVLATHTPIHSKIAVHDKQVPYRSYVIGVDVPAGSVSPALIYDTERPYHYVRMERGAASRGRGDLLIVGGEDHPTGAHDDGAARWRKLEAWTRSRFPVGLRTSFRWSGQVFEPHDGLACIGADRGARHLWMITGAAGTGMTYAMIGAKLLTDAWAGRANAWAKIYDPSRPIRKAQREPGVQKGAKADPEQAKRDPAPSVRAIPTGGGAVVHQHGHAYAVHRSRDGALHRMSALCTHLGCPVAWNTTERSWDCTCHGSRFDARGAVVTGPAIEDLRSVQATRKK